MADTSIEYYQIIQTAPGTIEIYLEGSRMNFEESSIRVLQAYQELLASYGIENVEFKFFDFIPPKNALDKMKRIISYHNHKKRVKA